MNKSFFQICRDAWEETGLSGAGPVDVAKATGIEKRMAGWVIQAWLDIQGYRSDWPWMLREFVFTTSPDKQRYPLVELNLTDVERWEFLGASIFRTADGRKGEQPIGSINYQRWWQRYRMGEQIPAQPGCLLFDPMDNTLMCYPVPNDEYTITLRYYKAPQVLAANGDIPLMPTNEAWREIIKWQALYYYGFHEGDPAILDEGEIKYEEMIHAMDNTFGQIISIGKRPIA